MKLVEVTKGTWVRPDEVHSVVAFDKETVGTGNRAIVAPPKVVINYADDQSLSWERDSVDSAQKLAADIAGRVNEALEGDDEPLPEGGETA